jgi:hypothetical protein
MLERVEGMAWDSPKVRWFTLLDHRTSSTPFRTLGERAEDIDILGNRDVTLRGESR